MESQNMGKAWKALHYLGICAIYCYAYLLLKYAPFYLNLPAALRLAALVAMPVRAWPGLLLADMVANSVYTSPRFGVHPYTDLSAIISIVGYPLSSLPAAWVAKRRKLQLASGSIDQVKTLLIAAACQTIFGTIVGVAYVLSCDMSIQEQHSTVWNVIELYSTGHLLGALTLLPAFGWALYQLTAETHGKRRWPETGYPALAIWMLCAACFCTIGVLLAFTVGPGKLLFPVRLALFLTVVVCTLREGWRGAAVSVLIVNLALELTQVRLGRDPDLATLHELSAFLSAFALWVGALITRHRAASTRIAADNERLQKQLARHASLPLKIKQQHAEMLDHLISNLSVSETLLRGSPGDREQAQQLWWRVISRHRRELRSQRDALKPEVLDSHGLRVALASGPIAAALQDAGVRFYVHAVDSLDGISADVQAAVYHIVHDGITRHLQHGAVEFVSLKMRTGNLAGRRWVGVRVEMGMNDDYSAESGARSRADLVSLAELYGGRFRDSSVRNVRILSTVLFEDGLEAILGPQVATA